jgi:hypothetical protein
MGGEKVMITLVWVHLRNIVGNKHEKWAVYLDYDSDQMALETLVGGGGGSEKNKI